MSYLIIEMFFFLLVSAVLGVIVGWLAKGLLMARQERLREESFRLELRRSEARAGNLKNQLAEAFLVEERLREELSGSGAAAPVEGSGTEQLDTLQAELALRDKRIVMLKLQVTQSEAALASEWQSLKAMKTELAERQERLEERGKQVSGKLRSSEEILQQHRLQLRAMKLQGERWQEELTTSQQALADERWESAARIAKLEARLEEQETMVALLSADEERAPAVAAEAETPTLAEEPPAEEPPAAEEPVDDDLEQIRGIGPVLHRKLNEIGVTSFRQIAAWTDDDLVEVARRTRIAAGRIRRDGWVAAASALIDRGDRRGQADP